MRMRGSRRGFIVKKRRKSHRYFASDYSQREFTMIFLCSRNEGRILLLKLAEQRVQHVLGEQEGADLFAVVSTELMWSKAQASPGSTS